MQCDGVLMGLVQRYPMRPLMCSVRLHIRKFANETFVALAFETYLPARSGGCILLASETEL